MKNKIFAFIVLAWGLMVATPAKGQQIEFIINDGVNISSLVGVDDMSPKFGYFSEVGLGYKFNPTWGVELDVAWSAQGAKSRIGDASYTYNYGYMNVPLLATYTLPKYNLTILGGVQAGLFAVASYSFKYKVDGEVLSGGKGGIDNSHFHPCDFGATIGVRWLASPQYKIGFEARYTLGLTQTHNGISDSLADAPYISIPDNRNSVFRLGVFLML